MSAPAQKPKERKSQTEEAWLEQLQLFQLEGPLNQNPHYFDDRSGDQHPKLDNLDPNRRAASIMGSAPCTAAILTPKMGLNCIKSASERQYYLRNYARSLELAEQGKALSKGSAVREFECIITSALRKLA